jgi:hypothetical protein
VYEGEWIDGLKEGKGVYKYANGDMYEGEFHLDRIEGKGRCIFRGGQVHAGVFQNGIPITAKLTKRDWGHHNL